MCRRLRQRAVAGRFAVRLYFPDVASGIFEFEAPPRYPINLTFVVEPVKHATEADAREAVVWPSGRKVFAERLTIERLGDLSGKTIGEIWDNVFRGEQIFPLLRELLSKRFPGIRFVPYDVFGNVHGPNQRELVAQLPAKLAQHGVDGVIAGIGA